MIGYAMRRWGALDVLARRLLRNVGVIVGGDAGASAIALVSLALTARALGPELLGVLVMIEAYATLVDRWIRPETWQMLIKYGSDALENDDRQGFKSLIKFSFLIDACGALIAITVAILGVRFAASWLDWSEEIAGFASLYCVVLIMKMTSTPTAILRLFDRYGVFAYSQMAAASARLALVALAWWFGGGLLTFVLIALLVNTVQPAIMIYQAAQELKHRGYLEIMSASVGVAVKQHPRIWRFLLSANLSLLLRKTVENTDVLIVGAFFSPAASGGLHIVKRLADVLLKLGRPVQQVIYPEVSKLWVQGEIQRFRKAVGWTNLIGGGLGLVVLAVVAIDPTFILKLFAGDAFANLANLLLVQMFAVVLFMFGLALRPALYSMEQDFALLKVVTLATVAFYVTFFSLMPSLGVMAASLGHTAFNAVWLLLCLRCFRSRIAEYSTA